MLLLSVSDMIIGGCFQNRCAAVNFEPVVDIQKFEELTYTGFPCVDIIWNHHIDLNSIPQESISMQLIESKELSSLNNKALCEIFFAKCHTIHWFEISSNEVFPCSTSWLTSVEILFPDQTSIFPSFKIATSLNHISAWKLTDTNYLAQNGCLMWRWLEAHNTTATFSLTTPNRYIY